MSDDVISNITDNIMNIKKKRKEPTRRKQPAKRRKTENEEYVYEADIDEGDSDDDDDDTEVNLWELLTRRPPLTTTPPVQKKPIIEDKCNNPLCNHKTFEEDKKKIKMPNLKIINDIDDLITLGKTYHCKKNKELNGINLRLLCNLVTPLTELKMMVGMKSVKASIVSQILFFLQGFNKNNKCNNCVDCTYKLPCARNHEDMLHTVITGPPGVGKTELGKILAKVYKEMGVLSKGHFTLVTRSDLIGKYLGHTADMTQKKINECAGGVMFIDEAYALGHVDGRDSFSKECLDTLNQNLSEKRDFLCIIAGYKDNLDKCFFKANEGLKRRFTFRYDIENYNGDELKDIFLLKLAKDNWDIDMNMNEITKFNEFFKTNKHHFPNYGGDVETLFLNCKIYHGKRMLFNDPSKRRKLSLNDVESGFKTYLDNRKLKNDMAVDNVWK